MNSVARPIIQSILLFLPNKDLCSLSETDSVFNQETYVRRVYRVMKMLRTGWIPKDRSRFYLGEKVDMYPPNGMMTNSDYLMLAEAFGEYASLKNNLPAAVTEGGFEWKMDVVAAALYNDYCTRTYGNSQSAELSSYGMQIRGYGCNAPTLMSTWNKTREHWQKKGEMHDRVRIGNKYYPPRRIEGVPFVTWQIKWFTPRNKLDRMIDILLEKGWKIIRWNAKENKGMTKRKRAPMSEIIPPTLKMNKKKKLH